MRLVDVHHRKYAWNKASNPVPTSFSLNGTTCTVGYLVVGGYFSTVRSQDSEVLTWMSAAAWARDWLRAFSAR